jgi:hypothetical protein
MSETMLMALEGTYEPFTLGRDLTVEQVQRIGDIAKKHGFKLAGFRSLKKPSTKPPSRACATMQNANATPFLPPCRCRWRYNNVILHSAPVQGRAEAHQQSRYPATAILLI